MSVYLAHGFNTRGRYLEPLAEQLRTRGYDAIPFHYGYHFLGTRLASQTAAYALASVTKVDDSWVCHSNGANVAHRAIELGSNPRTVVLISPSLDVDIELPASFTGHIHVFHTKHDWWTIAGSYWPWSRWGAMGHYGYQGNSKQWTNHDFSEIVKGHSKWFWGDCKWLAGRINSAIRERTVDDRFRRADGQ